MKDLILTHVAELRSLKLSAVDTKPWEEVLSKISAGDFMGECVKILAKSNRLPKNLRHIQGIGFWPIPLFFPQILARAILLTEETIVSLREGRQWDKAEKLAEVRKILVHLSCMPEVLNGEQMSDLSGDHCKVFLQDHPQILTLPKDIERKLPWWTLCSWLLLETSALRLLGAISDNEDGSIGEELALASTKLLSDGKFFRMHTVAEEEHAKLAKQMERIVLSEKDWSREYIFGKVRHRIWYAEVAGI